MSLHQTDTKSSDAAKPTDIETTDTRPLHSPLRPLIWMLVVFGAVLLFGAFANQ